jgi:UrcA family protein
MRKFLMGAAALAVIAATPAGAAAGTEGQSTAFARTSDLDLTTAGGQKTLRLRLMHEVSAICPIGSKCRSPALKRVFGEADRLIKAAIAGEAVPPSVRISF